MSETPNQRLLALDTLRGFDMFWIIGGGLFFIALSEQTEWVWASAISKQMHHAEWGSFHFFDLIFPLFILISGVAIPYSLFRRLEQGETRKRIYLKILTRFVALVLLGVVYNEGLQLKLGELRVASVLGLIGGAYAIGACIAINFRTARAIACWIASILVSYSVLQLFIPVPGHGAGVLTVQGSWNGYIDNIFLPGKKIYNRMLDPEGILAVMVHSSLTLMGVWAGLQLQRTDLQPYRRTVYIVVVGVLLIITALILAIQYPIIKALATTPYILLSGGLSLLLLAVFYLVIDVWRFQRWTLFFRVIGMNSILIYMATKMIDFSHSAEFFFGGVARWSGNFGPVVIVIGVICIEWLILYLLYIKRTFVKI